MKTITYLFLILVLVTACGGEQPAQVDELPKADESALEVNRNEVDESLVEPIKESNHKAISVRGYIDVPPENRAAISPLYGGFVKEIKLIPGQAVKEGQVLFILQNPDYLTTQQDYLEAKEQLAYLKADFERQKTLAEENIASAKSFKKAESDYKVMLARYEGLKAQIQLMGLSIEVLNRGKLTKTITVRSTITGSVTDVHITKSAYIDAKEVAIEIVNTDHIHLELQVFEKDAMAVREGQEIIFKVPESSDRTFEGEVYLVGKSIDPQNRTIMVHGHIHQETEVEFIPGMFVEAQIRLN